MSFENDIWKLKKNLWAFARKLCNDAERAEDLVQDTFVKALRNRASFIEGSNLQAWLFMILKNTYLSEYRKRRPMVYASVRGEDVFDFLQSNCAAAPNQEACEDLREVLKKLASETLENRQIVIGLAVGRSYEETALRHHLARGTVKSRAHRTREKLYAHLHGEALRETKRVRYVRKPRQAPSEGAEEKPSYPVKIYTREEISEFAASWQSVPKRVAVHELSPQDRSATN